MALVWTATDTDVSNWAWENPITWTDAAIGTADATRVVVLSILSPQRFLTGITIGGVTATLVGSQLQTDTVELSMWRAAVPTGTTAAVVVTGAAGIGDLEMSLGVLTGATATPTATTSDGWRSTGASGTVSVTETIPTGGIMLFASGAPTRTFAWTFDKGTADSAVLAGATAGALRAGSFATAGSQTITATGSTWDSGAMVAGVWEPAGTTGQFARPASDVADGGWLNEAASNVNLFESINEETASDTDYIESSVNPVEDTCIIGLSGIQTPDVGDIIMRIRAKVI